MPTKDGDITFKYGSQNSYDSIPEIDNNTIYVTTDTHRIYIAGVDYTEDTQMNDATKQYIDANCAIVESRIGGIVDEKIGDSVAVATAEWLESNVNPTGGAVVVDSSLKISGAAADAKATGNIRQQVLDLNDDLTNLSGSVDWRYDFENKSMSSQGSVEDSEVRLLSKMVSISSGDTFSMDGYEFRYACYAQNGDFVELSEWRNSVTFGEFFISQNLPKTRFHIRNATNPNSPITPDEVTNSIDTNIHISKVYNNVSEELRELEIQTQSHKNLLTVSSNYAEYGSIAVATGVPTTTNGRIRSGFIKPNTVPFTFTANTGYTFNYVVYDETLSYVSGGVDRTELTVNSPKRYVRFIVKKNNNESVSTNEFADAFSSSFDNCTVYGTLYDIETIRQNMNDLNNIHSLVENINELNDPFQNFSLNKNLTGLQCMVWEYQNWVYPQVISYNGIRNNLYFTFTNKAGYSGIARYDYDTQEVTKTFLKKNTIADDHNLIAVLMMSNGKLLCSYSGGHNTDKYIFIRIAESNESIESFEKAICLESSELTSYSQLFEYDNKIYLFYRTGNNGWSYRISEDFGYTWSTETKLIQATHQYYCQFTETTTNGVLRLCCYSNPEQNDTNIRMAFLHLDTMDLYDIDNSTIIGCQSIPPSDISVVVPITAGKLNRLFNAAKTAVGDTKILYCKFSVDSSSDGEYYIYDNGSNIKVADAGLALWIPKAQLGVAWIGTNQIAVARGHEGADMIEIYNYNNGVVTLNNLVTSKARGTNGIRTARPMIDNHQKTLLYIQGYFDGNSFYNFTMDAHIYNLDSQ